MKLATIYFGAPIPIAGTMKRLQVFDAAEGWTVDRDEHGDIHIVGNGVDFWTDGFVSWVPAPVEVKPDGLQTAPETNGLLSAQVSCAEQARTPARTRSRKR